MRLFCLSHHSTLTHCFNVVCSFQQFIKFRFGKIQNGTCIIINNSVVLLPVRIPQKQCTCSDLRFVTLGMSNSDTRNVKRKINHLKDPVPVVCQTEDDTPSTKRICWEMTQRYAKKK